MHIFNFFSNFPFFEFCFIQEEERENERLKKRQSSATSSRPDTSMSYHRSNTMYGTPEPSPPYELPGKVSSMTISLNQLIALLSLSHVGFSATDCLPNMRQQILHLFFFNLLYSYNWLNRLCDIFPPSGGSKGGEGGTRDTRPSP